MTFISEDFELTISTSIESLLRYIWHPSVLSIDIVGTLPSTLNNEQISILHGFVILRYFHVTHLHLHRLAIHKFNARNEGLKDNGALRTRIQDDAVDFPFDVQNAVTASEHVYDIVHFSIFDD